MTPRGWTALSLAGAAIGLAVGGPATAAGLGNSPGGSVGGPETLWLAQAATEGGEAGEAGEAGAAMGGDETVDLLYDLGVLEGALRAGVALYRAGRAEAAAPHLKRPEDDSYDELTYHLADAGAEGFPAELTALADTARADKPVAEVEAAFAAVLAKIDAARGKAGASEAAEAAAIVAILRKAADDHAEGVRDGRLAEPGEYQEAWGLAEVARRLAGKMAAEDDAAEKAFGEKTLAALDAARPALPDVAPEAAPPGDASALFAAAATAELAAYRLK
ncbi:hypothetical protein [Albidovulum sp.]|uniref:hypothetical protein n=1 Tax=Albidovulum sp. TaxID=1872424 RepID=UPI0039B85A6A